MYILHYSITRFTLPYARLKGKISSFTLVLLPDVRTTAFSLLVKNSIPNRNESI